MDVPDRGAVVFLTNMAAQGPGSERHRIVMSPDPVQSTKRIMEPSERIAEVLFGLILSLTKALGG